MKHGREIDVSIVKNRRLTKDVAYYELKEKIIYGELEPDKIVREEWLAEMLEISRTPLRQAIQMLEMEDFLIRQPNGRLRVAPISRAEVEEIFMIRSMLEGKIAKHATENITENEMEHLTTILDKLRQSFKLGSGQEFVSHGNDFHDYLGEISGLKTSVKLLSMVKDHANRYCRFVSMYGKWNEEADEEHVRILKNIKQRDGNGAEQAMKDHILSSLQDVVNRIDQKAQ